MTITAALFNRLVFFLSEPKHAFQKAFQLSDNRPLSDGMCFTVMKFARGGGLYSEVQVEQVSIWLGSVQEPPVHLNRMTDMTESITFPQLRWRTVMKNVILYLFMWREDVI